MIQWDTASWFDGSGSGQVLSYDDVMNSVTQHASTCDIHVGADSQPTKGGVLFAVTICIHNIGKGAFYFFAKEFSPDKQYKNLGTRLHHESELAISIASTIRDTTGNQDITIHADVSANPVYKSSKYSDRIQSFIKAMGFKCMIKPYSWAAWVADKHVK